MMQPVPSEKVTALAPIQDYLLGMAAFLMMTRDGQGR